VTSRQCGDFIALLRKEKNLTQKQLADELKVSDKAVSRWETGKGYPDVTSLVALSEFFSVSVNELLSGNRFCNEELVDEAEKNIIGVIESKEKSEKKKNRSLIIVSVIFCVLLLPAAIPTFIYFIDSALSVASTENITEFIVLLVVGILLFAAGFAIRKGHISILHSYHYRKVTDREGYCNAMGKTQMLMSIPVIVSSFGSLFPSVEIVESAGTVILFLGLFVGCIFIFRHQYKYNGGIF
jgi:transcriptional regulator with XRE-family HTH domain